MREKLKEQTTQIFKTLIDQKDRDLVKRIEINEKFEIGLLAGMTPKSHKISRRVKDKLSHYLSLLPLRKLLREKKTKFRFRYLWTLHSGVLVETTAIINFSPAKSYFPVDFAIDRYRVDRSGRKNV